MLIPHLVGPQDKKALGGVFIAVSVRLFAVSLFGIFVPIYLYQNHISLKLIFGLYALDFTVRALVQPAIARLIDRFGAKVAFTLSNGSIVAFLVTILFVASHPILLIPAFILQCFSNALYFPAYYVVFIHAQRSAQRSQEIGHLQQMTLVALTLGPLIGGILLAFVGIWPIVIVASVLLLTSLRLLKDMPQTHRIKLARQPNETTFNTLDLISSVGRALDTQAASMIWPIAMFFLFGAYTQVGFLFAVSLASSLLLVRLATNLSVKGHRAGLLWYSGALNALLHLGRTVVTTVSGAFILNFTDGLTNVMSIIPSQSVMFDRADGHPIKYFSRFVFTANLASGIYWAVLAGALFYQSLSWVMVLAFVIAAVGSLVSPVFVHARNA